MRLIDTSILIDFFRGVPRAKDLMCDDEPVISMVSVHEIFTGFKYINNNLENKFFRDLFDYVELLEFNLPAAEESSSLAAVLRKKGVSINAMDLMIAGTAVAYNVTEIASKDNHFHEIEKISNIKILSY